MSILFSGGSIVTLEPGAEPEALLVRGARIEAVGAKRDILALAPDRVRHIDLRGRTLIPGFNDNHIHTVLMGDFLSQPLLHGLDADQIVDRIREAYADAPPGELILAFGWDYPAVPHPHRSLLDEAFPHNPVVLVQFSGHASWVNSSVLRRLKIDRHTPDPPGGSILRDAQGEPTGILREAAAHGLHRFRFQRLFINRKPQRPLVDLALSRLARAGVTSIQDNTWFPSTVRLYNEYRRKGKLTLRVSCWRRDSFPLLGRLMSWQRYDGAMLTRGPWKYFMDGTFSTRSAWLKEPYADDPENSGGSPDREQEITDLTARALHRRAQGAFHAIGDRTIHEFLNRLEALRADFPQIPDLRLRLEHAQLIDPADMPRLKELGVLVAAQPTALSTPEKDVGLLGPERALKAYPHRSLLDAGVHLSFGSDMPGEPIYEPLQAIHFVANRPGPERISPLEALSCYTQASAFAEFQEQYKGSLAAGKWADLVVLSDNPCTVPRETIKDIAVEMTVVGGKIVFAA